MPKTFEEWHTNTYPAATDEFVSAARESWHARDAEITDLKEQLRKATRECHPAACRDEMTWRAELAEVRQAAESAYFLTMTENGRYRIFQCDGNGDASGAEIKAPSPSTSALDRIVVKAVREARMQFMEAMHKCRDERGTENVYDFIGEYFPLDDTWNG